MQASDRVLAGRYAAALFQAASTKGEEQKVQADLGSARELLLGAMSALRHPRVPPASKKKLLHDAIGDKVGATTLNFLNLLVDKKRFELMVMVTAVYAKLAAEKRGAAKAQVRTAKPLSSDELKTLAAKLKNFSGKEIELDVKEDPELIGGIAVKIGDWVLDSSLRGQLRRLKESFN
ncbi:MAG: ATP synthase F1 subunit delta [Elusimicrobiota bacterium]|nr:ATP synthase F1 subunit delta [Elusimicrobiota bacterium]